MKKKVLIILLIVLLGSVGFIIFTSRAEEEANTHTITIKKETKDNKQGEFTYRIKVWKEEDEEIYDYIQIATITSNYSEAAVGTIETLSVPIKFSDYEFQANSLYDWCESWNNYNPPYVYGGYLMGVTKNGVFKSFIEETMGIYNNRQVGPYSTPTEEGTKFSNAIETLFSALDSNNYEVDANGYYKTNVDIFYDNQSYNIFLDRPFKFDKYEDTDGGYSDIYIKTIIYNQKLNAYLDLSSQLGNPIEENTYEFTLNNGETKQISIPEGYTIEIEEVGQEGWILESINDNRDITRVEEEVIGNKTYTFKNRSTNKETYTVTTHHYKENTTEKLSEDVVETLEEDSEYETSSISIDGYELVNSPDNATGVVDGNKEVIYYYKEIKKEEVKPNSSEKEVKEKVKIIVHHMDRAGNKLDEDEVMVIDKGSRYITGSSSKLKGYTVIRPNNYEGVANTDIELTYVYSKNDKLVNPITGNGGLISYILIFLLTLSMLITYSISKRNSRL